MSLIKLDQAKVRESLLGKIASVRFEHEASGTNISGMPVATDRQSQGLITGAALSAMRDAAYTTRWKTKGGFITLDAPTILAVADAVRDHVQACFNREDELVAAIAAGTFEYRMLDEGWPV